MKKTISIIYKTGYIFLALWAFLALILPFNGANIQKLLTLSSLINLFGLISLFIALIMTVKSKNWKTALRFKTFCAFLSLFLALLNFRLFTNPSAQGFVMNMFLPLLAFLDWLIFDKKGDLGAADLLIWLFGTAALAFLLFMSCKKLIGISDFLSFLGLSSLNAALFYALLSIALMFLFDKAQKASKSFKNIKALLWRISFLLLEGFALFEISGKSLSAFLSSLKNFAIFSNFLCFICILASLLYGLIKQGSLLKQISLFPRAKGIFTFCILSSFIIFHFASGGKITSLEGYILYLIAPLMMLFDWILFDKKGEFHKTEPLLWLILPICHTAIIQCLSGFSGFDLLYHLKRLAILFVIGLILFITDRILSLSKK